MHKQIKKTPHEQAIATTVFKSISYLFGSYTTHKQIMSNCITASVAENIPELMDSQWFYHNSARRRRYMCGIAREAIISFLHQHVERNIFMGPDWIVALTIFKDRPPVLGSIIEEIIISKILENGLCVGDSDGSFILPVGNLIIFDGLIPNISIEQKCMYYRPQRFYYKAVNLVYVGINIDKGTACVSGIQITIGRKHSDS